MTRSSVAAITTAVLTVLVPIVTAGQPKGEVGQFSDVTVEGSVLEPSPIRVSDDAQLAGLITAPEKFWRIVDGLPGAATGAAASVRPADPDAMRKPPEWDEVDETSDDSFPPSDRPARG